VAEVHLQATIDTLSKILNLQKIVNLNNPKSSSATNNPVIPISFRCGTSVTYLNLACNFGSNRNMQFAIIDDITNSRIYQFTGKVGTSYNSNTFLINEL
jgi:hypothetical protein